MFERFTDRARRVCVLAQEEAKLLGHNHMGTEHLLLGLLREHEGVAAQVLAKLGLDLDGVRKAVTEAAGEGPGTSVVHLPYTPRAKKVLELSLREALQLGHNYIGTEHILLGLIREGDGVAAQVLTAYGLNPAKVRSKVIEHLHGRVKQPRTLQEQLDDLAARVEALEKERDLDLVIMEIRRRLEG